VFPHEVAIDDLGEIIESGWRCIAIGFMILKSNRLLPERF
jgi:hypothetical protein